MKKAKVLKWWSKHNLPDELWPEILSRLPVKSLLRFRCVSRSWKTWIDDPDFTRLHLSRFNNRAQSQILFVYNLGQCVVKNIDTLRTTFSLGFPQSNLESPHVLRSTSFRFRGISGVSRRSIASSIDGLVLLHFRPHLMLWNPSIRKMLPLPPHPEIILPGVKYENPRNVSFGLGFDPLIRDYKAVKFILLPNEGVHFAAVYTLGTNSWKLIECRVEGRKDLSFDCWRSSVSFNGVIYGIARDYHTFNFKLASFNLRSEVFAWFELPVNGPSKYFLSIIDDGCSLALIDLNQSDVSVWVLEGLGDDTKAWSWIQRYTSVTVRPPGDLADYRFLCIKKNGEMLLKSQNMVVCCNLETQERKIFMEKNKRKFEAANTFTYKESLILLT